MAKKRERDAQQEKKAQLSDAPWSVEMAASAETVYVDLYRKAKTAEANSHSESAHCTTFNMVREAIKVIIPNDPLNKRYALRGKLSNIFRLRKGRLRICWIASSASRRICVLFIAETLRKDGDSNDPYVVFQNLLESGRFDEVMRAFEVRTQRTSR
jgi:mRNA-degrading endonuclease RelE of RelBE toxin-antitoxin system